MRRESESGIQVEAVDSLRLERNILSSPSPGAVRRPILLTPDTKSRERRGREQKMESERVAKRAEIQTESADFEQRKSRFRTEEEQISNRGRAEFKQKSRFSTEGQAVDREKSQLS